MSVMFSGDAATEASWWFCSKGMPTVKRTPT
jgi:hypothetical protein